MLEPKNQLLMNTFVGVDIIIAIGFILIKIYSQKIYEVLKRIVIKLFYLNKEVKSSHLYIMISLIMLNLANICNKLWKEPYIYIVIDITKNKNFNGKLRINWDRRAF